MPLDDIISRVKQEWEMARKTDPVGLPVRVEIIFAHCYGHVHPKYDQDVKIDKFEVVDFSTAGSEKIGASRPEEGTYQNVELTTYTVNTLRPRMSDLDDWRAKTEQNEETRQEDSGILPDVSDSGPPSQNV